MNVRSPCTGSYSIRPHFRAFVLGLAALAVSATAESNLIVNGDFETGTFASWTNFTTANGTTSPEVTLFDTTGAGASDAATFQVGQIVFTSGIQEGGGIFQNFIAPSGQLSLSANIAVENLGGLSNSEGGVFSLLLDGIELDSFVTGVIGPGAVIRSTLLANGSFGAGSHELRFLITRPYMVPGALHQYVDNVVVDDSVTAVPEPATLALLGLGLAGLGFARRKQ